MTGGQGRLAGEVTSRKPLKRERKREKNKLDQQPPDGKSVKLKAGASKFQSIIKKTRKLSRAQNRRAGETVSGRSLRMAERWARCESKEQLAGRK